MAKTIPSSRSTQTAQTRKSRTMLLPMPRKMADELVLPVHVALDALRRGHGSVQAALTLTHTMLLVGFMAEAGYGSATIEQMQTAEKVVLVAFDRGRDSGEWRFDDEAFATFATIASTYDRQLQRAPLRAIAEASERLDRLTAGQQ